MLFSSFILKTVWVMSTITINDECKVACALLIDTKLDQWPWMTLNCLNCKFSWNFVWFHRFGWKQWWN